MGNIAGVDLGGHLIKVAVRVPEDELLSCPIGKSGNGLMSFLGGQFPSEFGPVSDLLLTIRPDEQKEICNSVATMDYTELSHLIRQKNVVVDTEVTGGEIRFVDFAVSSAEEFLNSEAGQWLLKNGVASVGTVFFESLWIVWM